MSNVAVIGTGYVGLVTGTCLAETGNQVTCIDVDARKIAGLQRGKLPIFEPCLQGLVIKNTAADRLHFTTDLAEGIAAAEVIFLALPTPPNEDGSADVSRVLSVAEQLGKLLQHFTVVVVKSTVPPGTTDAVAKQLAHQATVPFAVASNPEFLREGFAVSDFLQPDRVVIGSHSDKALDILKELYKPYVDQPAQIICMEPRSSEMTKYAANSFLAAKVTFMNEVANICERIGADVDAVRRGIGADDRIGPRFLQPGIGFGGSCFPKDVRALQHTAQAQGYDFRLLDAIVKVNADQKLRLLDKALAYYKNSLHGKHFALWGLAFKPNTDDIRESPALEIIKAFLQKGARITAYDPQAMPATKALLGDLPGLRFARSAASASLHADALLIATEWEEFRSPQFADMKKRMKHPVIFDGRNIYQTDTMAQHGFYYESIGRKLVNID